eukprot:GHVR01115301.1.p3 GENE.GHVR01115301.1~~GHVR01115301.1.p3  ORF type:complete len:106 (-),score=15.24 GHVR01115301.1:564-881(-)
MATVSSWCAPSVARRPCMAGTSPPTCLGGSIAAAIQRHAAPRSASDHEVGHMHSSRNSIGGRVWRVTGNPNEGDVRHALAHQPQGTRRAVVANTTIGSLDTIVRR